MFTIYMALNELNGKVYIGQSTKWKRRVTFHKNLLKRGKHWNGHMQSAWDLSDTPAFIWLELGTYQTKDELDEAERFYIKWFKAIGLCYNFSDGGEGCPGFKMPQEAIEKSRQANLGRKLSPEHIENLKGPRPSLQGRKFKPETLERMSAARKGKKRPEMAANARNMNAKRVFTPEYRRKLSEANTGKKMPEAHKAKLANINTGNTYRLGKTFSEASRQKMSESQKRRFAKA